MDIQKNIECIKQIYPELIIKDYRQNNLGQNNTIIIVNNEVIFRFPKYEEGIKSLKLETKILESIKGKLSVPIPYPQYKSFESNKVGDVFTGYSMLTGKPLLQKLFLNIKDQQGVANRLALFLRELHCVEVKAFSDILDCETKDLSYWYQFYLNVKELLYSYMRKDAVDNLEKFFQENISEELLSFKPTLVHGDFGPTNILFDEVTESITGIIDFGSVSISDPAYDIASMIGPFGYGEDFIHKMIDIYPQITKYLKRAKFYAGTFALQEALFGIQHNDQSAFNDGIAYYR
ncbi:phosphotransferase family protein [Vallitalea okinawensis]|uniref:phosphotransferase family protein n=1 Tax=Vallitalea okinawensis TaxID=2078660 RepID=UPI00130016DB|nr:aminoglycoside phosphotransferase family protein [Vallitalea okinawensis]